MTKQDAQQIIERNPFSKFMKIEILRVEPGHVEGRMPFEPIEYNAHGCMHGGCSYALADTIGGIAAMSYGVDVMTVNASMNYLRPIADTEYVYCKADVIRHGRTVSVFEVTIYNAEEKMLMNGNITYFTVKSAKNEGE